MTLLLPNPARRWPLACGPDPATLGLRVIAGPLAAMRAARPAELARTSPAAPDARRLADVPAAIREAADLVLDGGELPGAPSTVIDLRAYEAEGDLDVLREGAMAADAVATVLR